MKVNRFLTVMSLFQLSLLLSLITAQAQAQEAPKVEVFVGPSYRQIERTAPFAGSNLAGWNTSQTYNFNNWLGLVADFGGHYGSFQSVNGKITGHRHTFMGGPRLSYRSGSRWTPFVHVLIGAEQANFSFNQTTPSPIKFKFGRTGLAFAPGIGVDVKINDRFAWRVVQLEYLLTRSRGDNFFNLRASTGLIIRFGK